MMDVVEARNARDTLVGTYHTLPDAAAGTFYRDKYGGKEWSVRAFDDRKELLEILLRAPKPFMPDFDVKDYRKWHSEMWDLIRQATNHHQGA